MRYLEQFTEIRDGVVGHFAPTMDPVNDDHLSGSLKLNDDEVVAKLIGKPWIYQSDGIPLDVCAIGGRTEAGDVLLLDIRSRGTKHRGVDVAAYKARTLLVDVNLNEIDHDKVSSVQFAYHGLYDWHTDRTLQDDPLIEEGKQVGWAAELRYGQGTTVQLDDGFTLRIGASSSVDGDFDRRTFATPLTITVQSDTRHPIHDHVVRLDAIHALLNIAHRDRVKSFGGSARLAPESRWCGLWEVDLMSTKATETGQQTFPYFGLDDIGGIETVAAWVAIVLKHRRAVVPIVRHVLEPNQTPEARLLSTAAAMESWVAAHRRTHDWAKKTDEEDLPAALVKAVDRSWDSWIGDSKKWVESFWSSYTHLKHQPQDDLDPYLVNVLEQSGRWLLTAAILDEAAGTLAPSAHLFGSSLHAAGREVRDALKMP